MFLLSLNYRLSPPRLVSTCTSRMKVFSLIDSQACAVEKNQVSSHDCPFEQAHWIWEMIENPIFNVFKVRSSVSLMTRDFRRRRSTSGMRPRAPILNTTLKRTPTLWRKEGATTESMSLDITWTMANSCSWKVTYSSIAVSLSSTVPKFLLQLHFNPSPHRFFSLRPRRDGSWLRGAWS